MARITVEDCLENVDNRFQLVLVATKRARQITNGADPLVPEDNDKPTVIALREIAEGLIGPAILDEEDIPPELSPFDPRAGAGDADATQDGFGLGAGFGAGAPDPANPFAPAGGQGGGYESDADADAALIAALQRELAAAADAEQRAIAADAATGGAASSVDPFKTTPDNAPDLPPLAPASDPNVGTGDAGATGLDAASDSELLGAVESSTTIPPQEDSKLWGLPAAGAGAISSSFNQGGQSGSDAGDNDNLLGADTGASEQTPSYTGSAAFTEAPTPSFGSGATTPDSDSSDVQDAPALFGSSVSETPAATPLTESIDSTLDSSSESIGEAFGATTSAFTATTNEEVTPTTLFGSSDATDSQAADSSGSETDEEEVTEFNLFADSGSDDTNEANEDTDGNPTTSEDPDKLDN